MIRIINQVLTLLDELDNDELRQFDVDIDTNIQSLSGSRRPMGPAHRRSDRSSHQPRENRGREEFKIEERVKKINRLLKKAQRNGHNINQILAANASKLPLIRTDITDETADIIVDRGDAMIEIENSVATISFESIDYTESVPIKIDSPAVETIQNISVTTFRIRPEDSSTCSE